LSQNQSELLRRERLDAAPGIARHARSKVLTMRTPSLQSFVVGAVLSVVACSGQISADSAWDDEEFEAGGADSRGGARNTSGTPNRGGSAGVAQGPRTGGRSGATPGVGGSPTGGVAGRGGSFGNGTGGKAAGTGGRASGMGGSTGNGGTATGGRASGGTTTTTGGRASGGTMSTGGRATGGTATGGTQSTGGRVTGGTATGGRATGGTTSTGGSNGGTPVGTCTDANRSLTSNGTGSHCNYTYEYWKDSGTGTLTLTPEGFSVEWSGINNLLGRKGRRPGSENLSVTYEANYQPNGNSYLCVYGWTTNPLVEYYIVDGWGNWRPPGGEGHVGSVSSDGGNYDIYRIPRSGPNIQGNGSFTQYWSVRTDKKTSGTITVGTHFNAWRANGMPLGSLYEVSMSVEGYQSSGKADVKFSMK
jgi:endo-1,4-beta-xylanase